MRFTGLIKALLILFLGVSGLVIAVSGHMLQSTALGWGWTAVPASAYERVIAGTMGIIFTSIGALLVYKLQ